MGWGSLKEEDSMVGALSSNREGVRSQDEEV
jgi:hypothetical protein